MATGIAPLLSSNSASRLTNPSDSTFARCPRHLRFAKCYSSSWPGYTARSWEGSSFWTISVGLQQSFNQNLLHHSGLKFRPSHLRAHTWRLSCVKSGEREGSSSSGQNFLDEQTLQRDLERAIEEENYSLAAKLRDDLRLLQDDAKSAVLAANNRFYEAFRNGDFVAMRSIWMEGDNVCCIHPGAGAISGYDLVMGSWEIVCGAEHEFPIMIDLRNVEVHVRGDVGYVTCLEVVKTKGRSWGRQVATNVFQRVDGKWLMCVHHASHVDM